MIALVGYPIVCLFVVGDAAIAQGPQRSVMTIELNRLEQHGSSCRIYLVIENRHDAAFSEFRLDLVLFDSGGVIDRRLTLNAGPLRANKTTVKEYEVVNARCAALGRVLLNDIPACLTRTPAPADCIDLVSLASRATVAFEK